MSAATLLRRDSDVVEIVSVRELRITEEHVENIISTAGYGVAYWAESATAEEWTDDAALALREPLDEGGHAVHILTADQIRQTWAEIAAGDHSMNRDILAQFDRALNDGEPDMIDSDAADVLVQIALLGKIVYG